LSDNAAKTIIEFDEWDPILEATAQGIGIGFLQGTFLTADPRMRALKVEGADMSVPQFVVCPSEYVQLQTVRAFLEITETMLDRGLNP
jgi:DNA-binding transcriptional LysR family regulator